MRIRPTLLACFIVLALLLVAGAPAKKVQETSWAEKHKKRKAAKKKKTARKFQADMRKTANRVGKEEKNCAKIVKAARAGDIAYLKQAAAILGNRLAARSKSCHDEHGYTPLHHAARKTPPVCPDADRWWQTSNKHDLPEVDASAEAAYWEALCGLAHAEASVSSSHKGKTPLHAACQGRYGNEGKVVSMLIEGGAAVEHKDNSDQTPLHDAAENDCMACAKHLLKAGANPEAADTKNQTPIDIAESLKFAKLAKMLKDHAAPASGDNEMASAEAEGIEAEVDEVVDL